jgi:hypothetical protein
VLHAPFAVKAHADSAVVARLILDRLQRHERF